MSYGGTFTETGRRAEVPGGRERGNEEGSVLRGDGASVWAGDQAWDRAVAMDDQHCSPHFLPRACALIMVTWEILQHICLLQLERVIYPNPLSCTLTVD